MSCSICISKTRDTFNLPRNYDRLMLVNGPKNYLSFNFPIHFYVDNALFESIDSYVLEKIKDSNPKMDTLISGNLDNVKRYIFSLYEIAIKAAYSQNRLLRHAILLVEKCFLIDVRDFGSKNNKRLIELAKFLGAFDGNLEQFSDFIDLHSLSIDILDAVWSNNGIIPRLNQIGQNKLGLLMMHLRDDVCSGGLQTESLTDEWIDNFRSSFFTLLEKQCDIVNFDGSFLSNNFVFLNSKGGEKPNPLSRYHICSFVSSENVVYSSVEHYFWWNKMQNVAPQRFVDHLLTLDPKILRETCLNWLACNTPLRDEEDDKLPDDQLLIEATYAKLEQNPAFFNYLLQNFDLLIDCDHSQESQLKHLIERFDLNTKLFTFFWSEKCEAPPDWLCLNNYGLILMKLRQVFINQHFTDILDRNCSEIKNIELQIPEALSANTYFLFDDRDVLKFDRFTNFVDESGKPFKSVYHYSFYKCLKTLKLDQEAEKLLQDITEPFECVRFTEYIVRLKSLFAEFVNYMNENDNAIMLQAFVLSDKQNNDKFAKMLRKLENNRLIYSNTNKQYGLCENKTTLIDAFNELYINPTILPVLLNNDSIKPKILGMGLWARHLELYKEHLLSQCERKAEDVETDYDFSAQIFRITSHTTKNETQDCVEKEYDKKPVNISLPSWTQFQKFIDTVLPDEAENIVQEEVKPAIGSASNDASKAVIKLEAVDQKPPAETKTTDSKVLLLTTAFEHCCNHAIAPENSSLPGSIYMKELLNQCRNENEAEGLGRNLAQCFEKLFGDELKCDLTSFLVNKSGLTSEDLHNIGRIVGYER
uniref:Uncharacterized protein n=1 Tax=Romanomermis culicivorax TaxID=13658 RepID=A0A915ISX1_ROMCU